LPQLLTWWLIVLAAVLLTASAIASPYSFNYDMVVFGWIIAMLWPRLRGLPDRALLLLVWTLPVTMLGFADVWLPFAAPLMAGFLAGYLAYDLTHYAQHHFPMRSGYAKYIKRYHMQHHYKDPNTRFGVSTPIWDWVFRTQGRE